MSSSNFNFTVKFFRPPQRTVSCNNGLLDTRTKHIVAKDRLIVAEQRTLDVARRKSAANLQLLAFEQKQLEKRSSSRHNLDRSLPTHHRATSEVNLQRSTSSGDTLEINQAKLYASLHNSNQNLLSLLKTADENTFEDSFIISDTETDEEENDDLKTMKKNRLQLPTVAVIPPEEDALFLLQ